MKKSKKIVLIILSAVLAVCLLGVVLFFGIFPACSKDVIPPDISTDVTTKRKTAPVDGSTPKDYGALDNVAFMAYVLDNQPAYHVYAHNATKSIGYEQITQSWKDYKSAQLSGKNTSIMVASDLSYSALVKSATQSCFLGDGTAYMRTGSTPEKNSVATDIKWSDAQPDFYTKDTYLKKYGEFSTELTVYVITEDTFESATDVTENADGTYSQTINLTSDAACWYQYGMKTRGGLKTYPTFEKITITFTFDAEWQVLETYCEEKASIAPSVLGGVSFDSNSKTTTTFSYGTECVDGKHYAYYPDYFDKYVGTITDNNPGGKDGEPELLEVLSGGFGRVIGESGQQFDLSLTVGETDYIGKVYLKLAEISVDALEVRLALEKKDSGKQDFYLEYKDKVLNAYYSDGFALTADIDGVLGSVNSFAEWINGVRAKEANGWEDEGISAQSDGLDLTSLLGALNMEFDDTSVTVSINSDNLMELGVGVDLAMSFDRKILEEGGNEYSFKTLNLNTVSLGGEQLNVRVGITPDGGSEIISHEPAEAPANLTEYLDGILALIKGDTFGVNISLDGSCKTVEYINGLEVYANATVKLTDYSEVAVHVPVSVKYQSLAVELTAFYTVKLSDGNYGKIYITLDSINGTAYGAKVCCDIKEVVNSVKALIDKFTASGASLLSEEGESAGVAEIVNLVLGLNFGSVIEELKADNQSLKVKINADEILTAFNVNLGIDLGSIGLSVGLNDGKATFAAEAEEFGLTLGVVASDGVIPEINPDEYADIVEYLNGVYTLLNGKSYVVDITLDKEVYAHTTAQLAFEGSTLSVYAPVTASYEGLSVELTVYYTIDITSGSYGEVYITLTRINEASYNAKVRCNVEELIDAVKNLIALFGGEGEAAAYAVSDIVNIDFNAIITEIIANGEEIKLGINVDEVLTLLNVNLGMEIGNATLKLTVNEGMLTLTGEVPAFGLTLTVNGSDEELPEVNPDEYADIVEYLNGVYTLLNGKSYVVDITLDKEVYAHTTAQLAFEGSTLSVYAPVTASYEGLNVGLTVFYTIDITSGSYGDVYITLTRINEASYNAKVRCNINEVIEAVKNLIAMFGGEGKSAAYAVSDIVNIDFNAIITEIIANGEEIKLGVNVDEVLTLLNVNLGIEIGNATLKLTVNEGMLTLTGEVPAFGLTLTVNGSDEELPEVNPDEYADIAEYLNGVYTLLNGKSYVVDITLDKEVYAHTTAQLAFEGSTLSVYAPVTASYEGFNVGLTVYYTIEITSGSYGNVYITLTEINGKEFDAKVCCNVEELIDAVKNLIALFGGEGEAAAYAVSDIVNIDFNSIITEIIANGEEIKLGVNVDEVLTLLNVNLGMEIGNATLKLTVNEGVLTLAGEVPAFGLTLTVNGSDEELPAYDTEGHIDAVQLVNFVEKAYINVKDIIEKEDIVFDVYINAIVDGVEMIVDGRGEVSWNNGKIRVAVTADMTITDIENGKNGNTVGINFVYEENSVKLAVNKLGLEITKSDITDVKDGLTEIIGRIQSLMSSGSAAAPASAGYALSENGKASLSAVIDLVLDALQNVTLKLVNSDEGELKDLVIEYASAGKIQLGANGGLKLILSVHDLADVKASVKSGSGSVIEGIKQELKKPEYKFYTDEEDFVHAVYKFVFAVFEDLTVDNALGNGTFEMDITLTGSESGISALDGINVNAKLFYTEKTKTTPKLLTAELVLDVKGTVVNAEVSYFDDYMFVNLTRIGGTVLDGIAFKASTEDVYSAAETIVRLATSQALFEVVERLTGGESVEEAISAASLQSEEIEENSALTEILNKILSVDFSNLIEVEEYPSGEHTLTIKPDELLSALGINISVGTVFLKSDPQRHTVEASVTNGEKPWLEIAANITNGGAHSTIDESKYIDIGFVATLLCDAEKIIGGFEDGKIVYSLQGNIDVAVNYSLINKTITLENSLLTFGLDDNNELYFNLTAHLNPASLIGIVITKDRNIGVTYYKNYITLALPDSGEYKVMTLDYLLDNLLDSNSSPVKWLLGTNDTAWDLITKAIGGMFNFEASGTKPQTAYLYELATAKKDNVFHLASILNGLAVNIGGESVVYKTGETAVKSLNLSGDYYALDINGAELTGGTVNTLYAAILRSADGISGLKAYAAIDKYVKINVNLSTVSTVADNHFNAAVGGKDIDFNHRVSVPENHTTEIFGCYSSDGSYGYSYILDNVTLKVVDFENVVTEYVLRYGSIVNLTNMWAPEWTDASKTRTVYYTDSDGNRVGETVYDLHNNAIGWKLILEESLFDAENSYTIYIRKGEDSALKKEIIYHTGVEGVGDVAGAFEQNDDGTVKLLDYDIDDYALLGLYADKDRTVEITDEEASAFEGTEVYCLYIYSKVVINGVEYKLNEENGNYYYSVSGYGNGIQKYFESDTYLTLENEISGYPVKKIEASVFKGLSLKNVIVPENITEIGAQAFMDNYGIETVVFLADSVTLGGDSADGNNRYVFFGCSISDNEKSSDYKNTNLVVYYNRLNGSSDWDCFRYDEGFIGIGSKTYRVNSYRGAWIYVEYSVNDYASTLNELTTGIKQTATTKEAVESYVVKALNDLTAPEGYINKYSVTVKLENIGDKHQKVIVTITLNDKSEWKYLNELTLKSAVAYTYDGVSVGAGEDYTVIIESNTVLSVPVAEGYTFLGYAYAAVASSEVLSFAHCDLSANAAKDDVYYLIWGVNRDKVSFAGITEEGNTPATENVTATEGSLYGWYTDDTFATEVKEISVSNTVLYARLRYTLDIQMFGQNRRFFMDNVTRGTSVYKDRNKRDTDFTTSFDAYTVLENSTVSAYIDGNYAYIDVQTNVSDSSFTLKLYVKEYKLILSNTIKGVKGFNCLTEAGVKAEALGHQDADLSSTLSYSINGDSAILLAV